MTNDLTIEIDQAALDAVPIFPLPGTVLLPHTLVSLHIFEPRYRQMMSYCLGGHRVMALAMLDERGEPDEYGRPPVYPIAGLGYVRRSARLPDGRYNIVLEGVARVDVSLEHPPDTAFRRAAARLLPDAEGEEAASVQAASHALRALCSRAFAGSESAEFMAGLAELGPGRLADTIAASAVDDVPERQRILEATDVVERLQLVSGALGFLLLDREEEPAPDAAEPRSMGWGITPGKA